MNAATPNVLTNERRRKNGGQVEWMHIVDDDDFHLAVSGVGTGADRHSAPEEASVCQRQNREGLVPWKAAQLVGVEFRKAGERRSGVFGLASDPLDFVRPGGHRAGEPCGEDTKDPGGVAGLIANADKVGGAGWIQSGLDRSLSSTDVQGTGYVIACAGRDDAEFGACPGNVLKRMVHHAVATSDYQSFDVGPAEQGRDVVGALRFERDNLGPARPQSFGDRRCVTQSLLVEKVNHSSRLAR